jgi:hypothetical protein
MISLPALSGYECLRALRRAGFDLVFVENGVAKLVRDSHPVEVPLDGCLSEDCVRELLAKARVQVSDFLDLLSRGRSFPRFRVARAARTG